MVIAEPKEDAPKVGQDRQTVTIVIPCYNQAHFLEECLASILQQTYPDWTAIVVDDHSSDGDQIAAVVATTGDSRIRVIRHERNRGLAAARNTGIKQSSTELILPVDSDDKLQPTCLESMVAKIVADETLDCVYPDLQLFGRSDKVVVFTGPPPGKTVLTVDDTIPGPGTMQRRRLWQRVGGYDESDVMRRGREDLEFYLRAFSQGCNAERVPEALYLYRISHTSMNIACRLADHIVGRYMYDKNKALFASAKEAKHFLGYFYHRAAIANFEEKQRRSAIVLAAKAVRLNPDSTHLRTLGKALVPHPVFRAWARGEVRKAIPFVGYPLRSSERYRPFFIIGVARSGNTLFRRILTSHSQLYIPPETFVLWSVIRRFRRYGRHMTWPDLVDLVMADFEFHPEFHTFESWLGPLVVRLRGAKTSRRNLAFLIHSFYQFHAEGRGETFVRWGDKTPMNSLDDTLIQNDTPRHLGAGTPQTLERLLKVFPDAQFLHIYRDGCDVVNSHLRGNFFNSIPQAAERWLHVIRQCRRFVRKYPNQSMEVRYEDLVGDAPTTISGVCRFLGVDFEPAMLSSESGASSLGDVPAWVWHKQVSQPINANNPGKGRRYFSAAERNQLQKLIGDDLAEYGYPPATTDTDS